MGKALEEINAPKAPAPQQDPMLDQLMATAARQQQSALQSEAAGDTASLMARYGMRLALGSAGSLPGWRGGTAPQAAAGFGR
jgi:hypothetical protein